MHELIQPLSATVMQQPAAPAAQGLYVHIPFCFHKCHYCDFYSIVDGSGAGGDRQAAFVDRMIQELTWRTGATELRPVTVFVGGGTPTLLRPGLWQRLLEAMHRLNLLQNVKEFTVEANPETLTDALLDVLVDGGVNRVSIGTQSFEQAMLKALERWHDPENVSSVVKVIRQHGIDNINLDLIFGIPGQTVSMVEADLDAALAMRPTHLSYYGLTYEPNTPLTQRLKSGQITPVDEENERHMYERLMARLAAAGFEHYEISNWALRTSSAAIRCRHNMLYWCSGDWIGIGPSAASHIDGRRWKNEGHLGRYLTGDGPPPMVDHEKLSPQRRVGEQIMMAMRLREGIGSQWVDAHLLDDDPRRQMIDELIALGMLEQTRTHVRLTERGLFVADEVLSRLL